MNSAHVVRRKTCDEELSGCNAMQCEPAESDGVGREEEHRLWIRGSDIGTRPAAPEELLPLQSAIEQSAVARETQQRDESVRRVLCFEKLECENRGGVKLKVDGGAPVVHAPYGHAPGL